MSAQKFVIFRENDRKGFTLVELLVVIAIIAILAVVGVTVFRSVTGSARDAKRKADIDAINKAFEAHYIPGSGYESAPLLASYFASGSVPAPPEGGSYFIASAVDGSGVKTCAKLENFPNPACNSPSSACYCQPSILSTPNPGASFNYFNSAGVVDNTSSGPNANPSAVIGYGSSQSPPSCDSNGTLDDGLIGYWKMDEASWNGTSGEVIDSSGNSKNGTNTTCPQQNCTISNTTATNLSDNPKPVSSRAGDFNGSGYVNMSQILPSSGAFTFSAWFKLNASGATGAGNAIIGTGTSDEQHISNVHLVVTSQDRIWFGGNEYSDGLGGANKIGTNRWYYVVGVYDGSSATLYVDGVKKRGPALFADASNAYNRGKTIIGSNFTYPNGRMHGLIDDVRIYNRALTEPEISLLAGGCVSP